MFSRVLSEHDLLLLPSFYIGEGHPGIIVEAFQCHVPVIATKLRGIAEVVQHEENGLLVEPGSVDSLKAAIDRILNDPDLYRRLRVGAKEREDFFRSGPWYDQVARDSVVWSPEGRLAHDDGPHWQKSNPPLPWDSGMRRKDGWVRFRLGETLA